MRAFLEMNRIRTSKNITPGTKLGLFNINRLSFHMGTDTRLMTKTIQRRTQTFMSYCLRMIPSVKWQSKARSEEFWERAGQIMSRRWKRTGHILGKPNTNITRQALTRNQQGNREGLQLLEERKSWKSSYTRDAHGKKWRTNLRMTGERCPWHIHLSKWQAMMMMKYFRNKNETSSRSSMRLYLYILF